MSRPLERTAFLSCPVLCRYKKTSILHVHSCSTCMPMSVMRGEQPWKEEEEGGRVGLACLPASGEKPAAANQQRETGFGGEGGSRLTACVGLKASERASEGWQGAGDKAQGSARTHARNAV